MKKISCVLMVILLLAGCGKQVEAPPVSTGIIQVTEEPGEAYSFYYNNKRETAKYEDEHRCYTGAYILGDKGVEYDIKKFEDMVGEHDIYIYHLKAGEPYPLSFVISCMTKDKMPYIIVEPMDEDNPWDYGNIKDMARQFGRFNIPTLVGWYPSPIVKGYDSERYVEYYRDVCDIFRANNKNTAFVWSVDSYNAEDCMEYYPGDEYVDWAGLEVYENINDSGVDIIDEQINYYCQMFQDTKPILLNVAVSHFSTVGYKYFINEAVKELERIYTLPEIYPCIKAINYMDYSEFEVFGDQTEKNNYLLTNDDDIKTAYKEMIDNDVYEVNREYKKLSKYNKMVRVSKQGVYLEDENGEIKIDDSRIGIDYKRKKVVLLN